MTDINHLLDRASDVPIRVDVDGDLARGRAAARRRRSRLTAVAAAAVLVAGAAVVGGFAATDGNGPRPGHAGSSESPVRSSTTPTAPPTPPPASVPPAIPHQTVTATPVEPASLVHTPYLDVPPPPRGWYVVGGQESYAMIARDGSDADLTGGFVGRLMVLLSHDQPDLPYATWRPYDVDGRTFYHQGADGGAESVWVQRDDGTWLRLQYPAAARFEVPDMVVYLAGVAVLPGAVAVS